MDTSPHRGFSPPPQTQWQDARRLYGEPPLSDVPAMVDGFVEALRGEAVDPTSLLIYREAIEGMVAWAMNQQRAAA